MNITKVIVGVTTGALLISSIGFVVSAKFQAQGHENAIITANQGLESTHSRVNKILQTSGITVKNFGDTKIKAIQEAVQRYADKPQLMMQWVQENPQQIDSKVWENFQQQIEVQYTQFDMDQKAKQSKVQAYKDFLGTTYTGVVASVVWSYPKVDTLKIMEQVISTNDSKETMKTGIDQAIKDPFGI